MRRRDFITVLGGVAAWPLHSHAQQTQRPSVVGVLWHAGSAEEEEVYLTVVQQAFRNLGYIEGRNIELQHRFPAENPALFESQARELAESKVDLIIAVTALAAKESQSLPEQFLLCLCFHQIQLALDLSLTLRGQSEVPRPPGSLRWTARMRRCGRGTRGRTGSLFDYLVGLGEKRSRDG